MREHITRATKATKRYATIASVIINVMAVGGIFCFTYGQAAGYVKFDTSPIQSVTSARDQLASRKVVVSDVLVSDDTLLAMPVTHAAVASAAKPIHQVSADPAALRKPERSPLAKER